MPATRIQSAMPQITMNTDDWTLTIDPDRGGSIVGCTIKGPDDAPHDLLYPHPKAGASFVMAPWSNRISDAQFDFEGQHISLNANHPDGTAIHGVARDLPWTIADRTPVSTRLTLDSRDVPPGASTSFPFSFGCSQRFELTGDGILLDLSVTNLDSRPFPAGCGHHPYFARTLFSSRDQLTIKAPVTGHYPAENQIPTGAPVDDDYCTALRNGDSFVGSELDEVFSNGNAPIELNWDKSGVKLTMECSEALNHLVVFTPLAAPYVCVEPTTMANNGFNAKDPSSVGVRILQPGETLETRIKIHLAKSES